MNKQVLIVIFLLAGMVVAQSSEDRIITIRGAPCLANELIVCYRADSTARAGPQHRFRQRMKSRYQARLINRFYSGAEHWRIGKGDLVRILDSLNLHPDIQYAEPNFILSGDLIPDDPEFSQQWALVNSGQTGGTEDADIDADAAWDISTGSADILVGIVDSGVDFHHQDLESNIWINPGEIAGNGLDDDSNGYIDDYYGYDFLNDLGDPIDEHGHGTHVAGIIGAIGNNSKGISGVSWSVRLLPLKFLGSDNSGPISAAITAIEYAIDTGVDFINASWGSTAYSQSLADAIQLAEQSDILFIASAGNITSDNDLFPHYPSNLDFDNIISVASSDQNDLISDFSNWGLNSVDLAAPGTAIYSTLPDSSYGYMSGTSMATPHVTGALVLARSVFPAMTTPELKEQILNSVDIKQDLVGLMTSAGRLNVAKAVESDLLADLSLEPAYLDFGIELIGQTSEIRTIYIENISLQIADIDSIIVDDGYEISYDNGFDQKTGPFQIAPGERDSIQVRFLPLVTQKYNRLVTVYYRPSATLQKNMVFQLLGTGVTGTILPGGAVSGIWQRESSPFYIEGDIFIPGGSSLIIEPGTRIQFVGHHSFTIGESAMLDARGSVNDSIVFTANDTRIGWNGIRMINSDNDDILSFCRIEYGLKSSAVNLEDERGGALYCLNSSPLIEFSLFRYNQAESGGGICLSGSDAILNNVTIIYNRAGLDGGAGLSCFDSDPRLFRVIISHNRTLYWYLSGDNGGGIYCRASSPQMLNVTISQNWAGNGGAIYITQSSEHLSLVNSVIWGNLPNEIEFSADARAKSLAIGYSVVEDGSHGISTTNSSTVYFLEGNLNTDPLFLNEDEGDFRLDSQSPCIDAGIQDTTILYNDDQNTIIVPSMSFVDNAPDMGAIESSDTPLHNLALRSGWNLVGWNIQTETQTPVQRFNGILSNLDVALSFEQEGLTYDPQVDDIFNTLRITDNQHGYWLRMTSTDNLVIAGEPVELPDSIFLEQGWNLISYLPQFSDSIHQALESILDHMIVAEAFDGGALTFDPQLPDSINTLHILRPGYGYWIKMTDADTLIFYNQDLPAVDGSSLAELNELYMPTKDVIPTNEWIDVFASSLSLSGESSGQEMKIFARDPDGVLCGEMKIDARGYLKMMPVYRDDFRTEDVDEGAQPGDSISFFINDIPIPVKLVWQQSGQVEDISHFITAIEFSGYTVKPLSYQLKQNYPNPFNSQCVIPFEVADPTEVTIDIFNILGQKVRTLLKTHKKPGEYQIKWDGKNDFGNALSSGIYFYKMVAGEFKMIKKMILLN